MSANERIERLRQLGLMPYQAQFVDAVLTGPAKRVVLNAPTGVGKRVAAAVLVAEAFSASPETRCLVLCPVALALQWQDLLTDRLPVPACVMTGGLYRRFQKEDAARPNPWLQHSVFVASYDFVKSPDRIDSLSQAGWTMVIFDEIHYCVGQRAKLVGRLWSDDRVSLCLGLTATAENLDSEMVTGATRVVWDRHILKDWEGKPLFRPLRMVSISFSRTPEEKRFRSVLMGALGDAAPGQRGLVHAMLVARANSSLYAIEQTLRRAAVQSSEGISLGSDDREDSAEPEGGTVADVLGSDMVSECLSGLESITKDAKLGAAARLIADMRRSDDSGIVVFTQFRDTAYYVSSRLAADGVPAEHLTGADSCSDRSEKMDRARRQAGVLVCTDAMAEGVDLSFAHRVVHYDLPWNPATLEQRIGRVMRLTQAHEVEVATLTCEDADDPEGSAMKRLSQKLETLRTTLGGGVL